MGITPDMPPTGAVLAGGLSTRMGTDKARLELPAGRTMLETVVDRLASVTREVVVVGGTASPPGIRLLTDTRAERGPLGGIETLLASGIAETYLVCTCDAPLIHCEALGALITAPPAPAVMLHLAGEKRPRPLPARVSAATLTIATAVLDTGRGAVRAFMEEAGAAVVDAPAAWADPLTDVNTPELLERVRERLRADRSGSGLTPRSRKRPGSPRS